MEQIQQGSIFTSDHLYVVAYLICCGHQIIGTWRRGQRISFQFSNTPALCADVAGYMADGVVPARKFSLELLRLKRTLNERK
jgi:hypothetical protein